MCCLQTVKKDLECYSRQPFKCFLVTGGIFFAVAWSVESLPSNPAARVRFPAGSGILISVLGLGVCPLSVFFPVLSSAEALTLC